MLEYGTARLIGGTMPTPRLGTNVTIFLLFFGVATLEAFQTRNWLKALFWVAIGVVFLLADNLKNRP
jgi:cell division protein FtsW (lipid II flippase)